MFRKRVTLFGRSIPLATILLAVGVAAAAWGAVLLIWSSNASGTATARPQGPVIAVISGPNCTLDGTGVLATCVQDNSLPRVIVTAIAGNDVEPPASVVTAVMRYRNNTPLPTAQGYSCATLSANTAPGIELTITPAIPCMGTGQELNVSFVFDFGLIQPLQTANLPAYQLAWDFYPLP